MSNRPRLAQGVKGSTIRNLLLLGLCLTYGLPLRAVDTGTPPGQDPQPVTAQSSSSPQGISTQTVAGVSASHFDATPATASASAAVASTPRPAAPAAVPRPDPDAGWTPAAYVNS